MNYCFGNIGAFNSVLNTVRDFFVRRRFTLCIIFFLSFSFNSNLNAQISSTASGGNWSNPATWAGGVVPGINDDVIIVAGAAVTINDNTDLCKTVTNNGIFTFTGGYNMDVYGDWINNGTFNANTGSVTFKGSTNASISGSFSTAFNNIIVDKGSDVTSIIEANGAGAISNTGNITITNGMFKMTTGTFQFKSNPNLTSSAGLWVNGATLNSVGSFSYDNNGLIKVTSGNDLHTAAGGTVEIDGGIVNISGSLYNSAGTAIITGGTINLATIGNNSAQGSFHMSLSTDLTINGNPLIVLNKQNSSTGGDITIFNSSGTKNITGGTFQLGSASSTSGSIFS